MSRTKQGPSRVTPKKKSDASGSTKGAATVALKTRDDEQKTGEFNELVEQQNSEPEPAAAELAEEPVTEFVYNGKTFQFCDMDKDVASAMTGIAAFSSGEEQAKRALKLCFVSPEEHARFISEMNDDIEKVLANRKQWKAEGSDPEDEPIDVLGFMKGVISDVIKLFRGTLSSYPKGRG